MSPNGRAIARYLGWLNRTAAKYRKARTEELAAKPREVTMRVPQGWPSNHTQVLAFLLARDAGCGKNWGDRL